MDISPEEWAEWVEIARLVAELRYQSSPLRKYKDLTERDEITKARHREFMRKYMRGYRKKLTPEAEEKKNVYMREYMRERYKTDPEYREREKARKRDSYKINPKRRERAAALTPEAKEKKNVYMREYMRGYRRCKKAETTTVVER